MLSKTIEFEDLDGNPVKETFYFRYRQSDLMKLHIIHEADGGYGEYLKKVADSKNGELIIETFEKMVAGCVGLKGDDNRTFLQNPEITAKFMQSDAYSEFFTEIVTDAEVAGAFFSSVVPQKLSKVAEEAVARARANGDTSIIGEEGLQPNTEPTPIPVAPDAEEPKLKDFEEYSRNELLAMSDEDFFKVVGTENVRHMTKVQQSIAMQRRTTADA